MNMFIISLFFGFPYILYFPLKFMQGVQSEVKSTRITEAIQ